MDLPSTVTVPWVVVVMGVDRRLTRLGDPESLSEPAWAGVLAVAGGAAKAGALHNSSEARTTARWLAFMAAPGTGRRQRGMGLSGYAAANTRLPGVLIASPPYSKGVQLIYPRPGGFRLQRYRMETGAGGCVALAGIWIQEPAWS